jgi:CubicO group peptidase (beta-lactamase class C family)
LSSSRLERVKRTMQAYVDQHKFAGIITLVARHGQVAHLEKFGWQEIETQRPMAFDTIFRIHSMTKPITSTAAMMLVDEGKMRLNDPVSRYIPAFKDAKVMVARNGCDYDLVPAVREMTVHDLCTHTAGLSYGIDEYSALDELYRKVFWETLYEQADATLEDMIRLIVKLPLAFHPGTAFRYSLAIDVLGYVVQVTSGHPFADFLQERIFSPLGMIDTSFWVPPEKVQRLAAVYGPVEGGEIKSIEPAEGSRCTNSKCWPSGGGSGGGGLVSTTSDYFRFGQMLLNGGVLEGVRLLRRKTVEWMLQNHLPDGIFPQVSMPDGFFPQAGPAFGFGLGGSVLLKPGLTQWSGSIGNFGWGGLANTHWWIDSAEGLQGLLMTQYIPAYTLPIVEDFSQTTYQALE